MNHLLLSTIVTLSYLLILFKIASGTKYRLISCQKNQSEGNDGREQSSPTEQQCQSLCNLTFIHAKKTINPYRLKIQSYVQPKPFSAICLRCAICLAVAKEVDLLLEETVDEVTESSHQKSEEILNEKIENLCNHGFQQYDLRRFDGLYSVSDDLKCSFHVHTKMNGQWTEKLRQMCVYYSGSADLPYLMKNRSRKNVSDYFCRSNGIFRDCLGTDFQAISDETCNSTQE